jgi:hypothetical protein
MYSAMTRDPTFYTQSPEVDPQDGNFQVRPLVSTFNTPIFAPVIPLLAYLSDQSRSTPPLDPCRFFANPRTGIALRRLKQRARRIS